MSYDWSDNVPPAKAERKTLRGWFAWQWYQLMIWAALDAPYDWIN